MVNLTSDDPGVEPGGMNQEPIDGNRLRKRRLDLQGLKIGVDVGSQVQKSSIDQLEQSGRCQGRGKRGGMDERALGIHRHAGGHVGHAVALDQQRTPVFDEGHHRTGHAMSLQPAGGQAIDVKTDESRASAREPR